MFCVLRSPHFFVGKNFFFFNWGITALQCCAGEVTSEITKYQTDNKSSTKQLKNTENYGWEEVGKASQRRQDFRRTWKESCIDAS